MAVAGWVCDGAQPVRGGQLDPHIVDVFLTLQSAGLIGHLDRVAHRVAPPPA